MSHNFENKLGFVPESIVILRALVIGDLLCSIPAFRALRRAFPSARIALVGLPWARDFVWRFSHLFDSFIEFPGYPGLPERKPDLARIPEFIREVQTQRFDLALQMHGSGSFVNSITQLFAARRSAGFYVEGEYCPDPELFMPFPEDEHEIRKYLRLTEFLGLGPERVGLEFPLFDEDYRSLQESGEDVLNDDYICIHPGARFLSRRWLPERFAAAADALAARGLQVVLTGTAEEKELTDRISGMMCAPHINLAGRTSLGALAVLLNHARLLICNDTGVSHMATALGTPSIVLVTGSDFKRWAPLDVSRHRTLYIPIACRPCYYTGECPIGYPCAHGITSGDVISVADEMLDRPVLHMQ